MHNALSYGVTKERNGLVSVLLNIKPHLLQQRDNDGRIPLQLMHSSRPHVHNGDHLAGYHPRGGRRM